MGFPEQQQDVPGVQSRMDPVPDCGETSYRGTGKLTGKTAVITGGDSGIGRAVAIAFAREGADVLISYLDEHDDAREVAELVDDAGRRAVTVAGDLSSPPPSRGETVPATTPHAPQPPHHRPNHRRPPGLHHRAPTWADLAVAYLPPAPSG